MTKVVSIVQMTISPAEHSDDNKTVKSHFIHTVLTVFIFTHCDLQHKIRKTSIRLGKS